jgi:hypothetical protein
MGICAPADLLVVILEALHQSSKLRWRIYGVLTRKPADRE